jgi:ATP-dependent Clp protease ATP-binding subunit ClpC
LARNEAEGLRHFSIGAEHIFLGLLLEGNGVAALALNNLGIRIERMRTELARTWAQP